MSDFDTNKMTIVIANRKYSSWSLRGWLALRLAAGKGNVNEIFCKLAGQGATPEVTNTDFYSKSACVKKFVLLFYFFE